MEARLVACDGPDGARVIFRTDPFGRRVAKVRRLVVADGRKVPSDTDVGTAYLWDGDHMIAEAPLKLSGAIDWGSSVRWHFEEDSHRLLAREGPDCESAQTIAPDYRLSNVLETLPKSVKGRGHDRRRS